MAADAFEKFKSSINRGVTTISVKTSSSLEKAKIKTHIDSLNTEVDRAFAAIGQLAFSQWESGAPDYSVLSEQFTAVQQKRQEIAQLQAEYAAIDARDNQILGTPAAPAAPAQPIVATCPNCGATYTTPVRFCRQCGQRLAE